MQHFSRRGHILPAPMLREHRIREPFPSSIFCRLLKRFCPKNGLGGQSLNHLHLLADFPVSPERAPVNLLEPVPSDYRERVFDAVVNHLRPEVADVVHHPVHLQPLVKPIVYSVGFRRRRRKLEHDPIPAPEHEAFTFHHSPPPPDRVSRA